MHYRRLGRSGLQISELSFGSWVTYGNQVNRNAAADLMAAAFDAGINFFDNAEVYAAELRTIAAELETLTREVEAASSAAVDQSPGADAAA